MREKVLEALARWVIKVLEKGQPNAEEMMTLIAAVETIARYCETEKDGLIR